MRFLLDAQLPRTLCGTLRKAGHDAIHTRDLPEGNCTSDDSVISIADDQQRIVISKDADLLFVEIT